MFVSLATLEILANEGDSAACTIIEDIMRLDKVRWNRRVRRIAAYQGALYVLNIDNERGWPENGRINWEMSYTDAPKG